MKSSTSSPFKQPKAVFAVAFACVVSFMGIGLVDPILPAISADLNATPSQVTLLFTSYLVITAVAMLITGWVSSRIGAKKTLITGLAIIVVFSALAGASDSIGGIVGFRAGWGVGNALFIATSLAVIVASATSGFVGAIILYETALGLGIAVGPLLGGLLGEVSWRGPFFGVAALMAIALIATVVLVEPLPKPAQRTSITAPLKALRHRGLLILSLTALCYNWAFFTVLGYAPFPMHLGAIELGFVFFGWGALVAIFSVFGAPRLQRRFGIARTLYLNLALFALVVLGIAIWTDSTATLVALVIVAGVFIGVNNTVTTQAVMTVAPVERPIASAAYGFVRFIGGGLAPFAAGKLVEATNVHVPFYIAAGALVIGIGVLSLARKELAEAERVQAEDGAEAAPVAPGNAIVAAIDDSPTADAVVDAAVKLATLHNRTVHVIHVQEQAATVSEDPQAADALIREQVARVKGTVGQVLTGATDHGEVGRLIADYAGKLGAKAIVVGAPRHGGLPALMDNSVSQELWRHAKAHILIVNPALNVSNDLAPLGRA
ncbi:MFS transporter [Kibdelosporangium phytohabitans]|uniref:MFS transporter n=1 Tax=Kibdelosporangium phytohabitans TaxID=860235 RepID=A0A0N9HS60_9PSEU|nr:MFS transporter [Kibdelosporangium phytohabitans]ALG05972.1 MFS transporter [Kibdelosporangium phytohabitans]MBE1465969.1 MFS family permease [Kibdelosporangium phytohabitans]